MPSPSSVTVIVGLLRLGEVKADDHFVRVRVVGVLDQFEHRQTRAADQLVAEKLQHPGSRSEWLAYAATLVH